MDLGDALKTIPKIDRNVIDIYGEVSSLKEVLFLVSQQNQAIITELQRLSEQIHDLRTLEISPEIMTAITEVIKEFSV